MNRQYTRTIKSHISNTLISSRFEINQKHSQSVDFRIWKVLNFTVQNNFDEEHHTWRAEK